MSCPLANSPKFWCFRGGLDSVKNGNSKWTTSGKISNVFSISDTYVEYKVTHVKDKLKSSKRNKAFNPLPSLYRGYEHAALSTIGSNLKNDNEASNFSGNEKRVKNNKSNNKRLHRDMNRSTHAGSENLHHFRSINKKSSKLLDDLFIMNKHRKYDGSYKKSVILNFL